MNVPNKNVAPLSIGPMLGGVEKNKKWQMELLMERLRTKSAQHRTFPELSRSTRMTLLEKRYALDAVEKSNLQKCLDSMQHSIKVTTRQGLVERLESLTRQLGLKFMYMEETSTLFISSDMFYLEILLDPNGGVQDVKVHHECKIELQSSSDLVDCLAKGDFVDFTAQLEGFASIYQLNAEPKIKSKAFVALQALEIDIYNIYKANLLRFSEDQPKVVLLQSPTGVVQKRRGGHAMKLTYFVAPMELLDLKTHSMLPITIDLIHSRNIGQSVTVNLEASVTHKLQVQPILNGTDYQNLTYAPLTTFNSTMLPANFVLTLNKPMPMCHSLVKQIIRLTELSFGGDLKNGSPIMSLIGQEASGGEIKNTSKGLFVTLPDQTHCYFMTENSQLQGELIKSIPFTEPVHVPRIIQLLRQQAVFNHLIASCVRLNGRQDIESMTMFEVGAISCQHISVSLEHPFEETMATVEFDLTNIGAIECKLFTPDRDDKQLTLKLSRIAQHCMSIPITLRSLIKIWEHEHKVHQQVRHTSAMGGGGESEMGREAQADGNNREQGNGGGGPNNNGLGDMLIDRSNGKNTMMMQTDLSNTGESRDHLDAPRTMFDNYVFDGGSNAMIDGNSGNMIKKRRMTGEDFWKSPKRNCSKSEQDQMTTAASSNEDSNSLGEDMQKKQTHILESKKDDESDETKDRQSVLASLGGDLFLNDDQGNELLNSKTGQIINDILNQANGSDEFNENTFDMDIDDDGDDDLDEDVQAESGNDDDDDEDSRASKNKGQSEVDSEDGSKHSSKEMRLDNGMGPFNDDDSTRDNRDKDNIEGDEEEKPAEDDDIGNLLNEMKNSQDFCDLIFNTSKKGTPAAHNSCEKSEEEKLPKMATPFVSITPITSSIISNSSHSTTEVTSTFFGTTTSSSSSSPSSSQSPFPSSSSSSSSLLMSTSKQKVTSPSPEAKLKSVLSDMGITEKRLGLEIIPISNAMQPAMATITKSASVTITPINASTSNTTSISSTHEKTGENVSMSQKSLKRSCSSPSGSTSSSLLSSDGEQRVKKKKRRDESKMGPPDKLTLTNLNKGDGGSSSPKSSGSIFNASPNAKNSPRQSPVHYNSPKYSGQTNSPKANSTSPFSSVSPKHGGASISGSGSGKPSMSTLKSASNSPKSERSPKASGSGSSGKERDKKLSQSNSPKLKSSSVKLKPIDLNAMLLAQEELSQDGSKSTNPLKAKKSSLSAVIDKLKSAQNTPEELMAALIRQTEKQQRAEMKQALIGSGSGNVSSGGATKGEKLTSSGNGSSYIIKPSLDGMKLTINKTRYKSESSKGGSSKGTGLKPGVSSGPASKKSGSPSPVKTSKLPFQKSSSSGNLLSSSMAPSTSQKQSTLAKASSGSDLSKLAYLGTMDGKKDKKPKAEGSTKSNPLDVLKMLGFSSGSTPAMDGFMKTLDKKFQIPKLSARSLSVDESGLGKKESPSKSAPTTPIGCLTPPISGGSSSSSCSSVGGTQSPMANSSEARNLTEFLTSKEVVSLKYPFPLNASANFNSPGGSAANMMPLNSTASESGPNAIDAMKANPQPMSYRSTANTNSKLPLSIDEKSDSIPQKQSEDMINAIMRPPSVPPLNHANDNVNKSQDTVLDFSKHSPTLEMNKRTVSPTIPLLNAGIPAAVLSSQNKVMASKLSPIGPSSSVSLHIVKSPMPSPMNAVAPSPHSNSPCITDDELMDEAVGISGK